MSQNQGQTITKTLSNVYCPKCNSTNVVEKKIFKPAGQSIDEYAEEGAKHTHQSPITWVECQDCGYSKQKKEKTKINPIRLPQHLPPNTTIPIRTICFDHNGKSEHDVHMA